MHTRTAEDHEGAFTPDAATRRCASCGETMTCEAWRSHDGGFEDYRYTCPRGHTLWVDGIDS